MSSFGRLELLEPDEVEEPLAASPPVDGLAVISGLRCNACRHLCASSKRLRRHWSESHGVKDPAPPCGRSVNLQTFFRGTKLRYFEVAADTVRAVTRDSDGRAERESDVLAATPPIAQTPDLPSTFEAPEIGQATTPAPAAFGVQSFMTTIQSCADQFLALRFAASSDDATEEAFNRAANHRESNSEADGLSNAPAKLLERVRTLPYRMAEALEKPDSMEDFTATLAAINALDECCSLCHASNDARAVWTGMESWLRRLPDHFKDMVSRQIPAALIVVAHWMVLVERAEHYHWFLKGSAIRLLQHIASDLPEDGGIQSLIEGLLR